MPNARTLLLVVLLAVSGSAAAADPEVVSEIAGDPVYQVLPEDAIPAIREPRFLRGDAADAQMRPEEPVLGLVLGGRAKAYSLWQLDAHEIVNDSLSGRDFAATW